MFVKFLSDLSAKVEENKVLSKPREKTVVSIVEEISDMMTRKKKKERKEAYIGKV